MPTIPSIRTAVENKNALVLDEHAKNGTFKKDARGRLIAYAGGFSVVFPYETINGEKWAFRCWHADISNSKKRYEIISDAIKKAQLSFLCDFEYVEKGINVEGSIFPTTRMRWIDGVTIKDYICQNKASGQIDTQGCYYSINVFKTESRCKIQRNTQHSEYQNNSHRHKMPFAA